MDIKIFTSAIAQIAEEKGISSNQILETIEMAFAAAYKKDYGKRGQIIKAKLDSGSGGAKFWQIKLVVDKEMIYSEQELEKLKAGIALTKVKTRTVVKEKKSTEVLEEEKIHFNPEKHIMFTEARKIDSKIKLGEELEIELQTKEDYGRIAAQTAKQVIIQRIREAERKNILEEYKSKEGEIISGIVQRIEGKSIFFDIGKISGILNKEEQVPGEFYRPGQRLKIFILKVEETIKGPMVFLSRAYPKLLSKLFELEVPEVSAGSVSIESVAREPGSRSKIAVSSNTDGVDPIGSMVGQKGTRVQAVINELGGEKIDVIEHSEESEKYITNAMSPAKVLGVKIMPKNKALVIVNDDQLSLAIGKEGQNVRLAAKLTGWKIDVRGQEDTKKVLAEEKKKPVKKSVKRKTTTKSQKL